MLVAVPVVEELCNDIARAYPLLEDMMQLSTAPPAKRKADSAATQEETEQLPSRDNEAEGSAGTPRQKAEVVEPLRTSRGGHGEVLDLSNCADGTALSIGSPSHNQRKEITFADALVKCDTRCRTPLPSSVVEQSDDDHAMRQWLVCGDPHSGLHCSPPFSLTGQQYSMDLIPTPHDPLSTFPPVTPTAHRSSWDGPSAKVAANHAAPESRHDVTCDYLLPSPSLVDETAPVSISHSVTSPPLQCATPTAACVLLGQGEPLIDAVEPHQSPLLHSPVGVTGAPPQHRGRTTPEEAAVLGIDGSVEDSMSEALQVFPAHSSRDVVPDVDSLIAHNYIILLDDGVDEQQLQPPADVLRAVGEVMEKCHLSGAWYGLDQLTSCSLGGQVTYVKDDSSRWQYSTIRSAAVKMARLPSVFQAPATDHPHDVAQLRTAEVTRHPALQHCLSCRRTCVLSDPSNSPRFSWSEGNTLPTMLGSAPTVLLACVTRRPEHTTSLSETKMPGTTTPKKATSGAASCHALNVQQQLYPEHGATPVICTALVQGAPCLDAAQLVHNAVLHGKSPSRSANSRSNKRDDANSHWEQEMPRPCSQPTRPLPANATMLCKSAIGIAEVQRCIFFLLPDAWLIVLSQLVQVLCSMATSSATTTASESTSASDATRQAFVRLSDDIPRVLQELVENARSTRNELAVQPSGERTQRHGQRAAPWFQTDGHSLRSWRRLLLSAGAGCIEMLESTFLAVTAAAAVEELMKSRECCSSCHDDLGHSMEWSPSAELLGKEVSGKEAVEEEEVAKSASRQRVLRRLLEHQRNSETLTEPWIHMDFNDSARRCSATTASLQNDVEGLGDGGYHAVVLLCGMAKSQQGIDRHRPQQPEEDEEILAERHHNNHLRSFLSRVAAHLTLLLSTSSVACTMHGQRCGRLRSGVKSASSFLDAIQRSYQQGGALAEVPPQTSDGREESYLRGSEKPEREILDVGCCTSTHPSGDTLVDDLSHPLSHVNVFRSLLYADTP